MANQDGEEAEDANHSITLANEIRNQMLYYKMLRDKHDNSLINTLQDLNNMLNSGETQRQSRKGNPECFVRLEHTRFSDENKKAMTLLIILLERKNEILKNLMKISTQRQLLLEKLVVLQS